MTRQTTVFFMENDLEQLPELQERLHQAARDLDLDQKCLFELELVFEELFTNIVKYGFDEPGGHPVEFRLSEEDCNLRVTITDEGRAFDPTAAPDPDTQCPMEDRPIGKLGIHLAKKLTDFMEYERKNDKNILTIQKQLQTTCRA